MIKAVVKFWGEDRNQSGMPVPYYAYLVISSPWQTEACGIASVVPITEGAPLSKRHFIAESGGERAAFIAAIGCLKSESGNRDLQFEFHEQ